MDEACTRVRRYVSGRDYTRGIPKWRLVSGGRTGDGRELLLAQILHKLVRTKLEGQFKSQQP
jgi:hypothetical protein